MATKKVPVPSVGRVVLYEPKVGGLLSDAWAASKAFMPAIVVRVDAKDPRKVQLVPLVSPGSWVGTFTGDLGSVTEASYGEHKLGCWWWPERVDATMEVEP